jgi:hypothetical protein
VSFTIITIEHIKKFAMKKKNGIVIHDKLLKCAQSIRVPHELQKVVPGLSCAPHLVQYPTDVSALSIVREGC